MNLDTSTDSKFAERVPEVKPGESWGAGEAIADGLCVVPVGPTLTTWAQQMLSGGESNTCGDVAGLCWEIYHLLVLNV